MTQELLWRIESLWEEEIANHKNSSCETKKSNTFSQLTRESKKYSFFTPQGNSLFLEASVGAVFTDDYGSYEGLKQSVLFYSREKPIYIFDNHNKALMAFMEIKKDTDIIYDVVHIDAHRDDAISQGDPGELTPDIIREVYEQSRISDFLDSSQKGNLIKEVHRITDTHTFKNPALPHTPYILSLDIDIFGPEGAFIDVETKIKTIFRAWINAEYITIATSPGFIDQTFARKLVKIFCK